jgi:hypothetical protein
MDHLNTVGIAALALAAVTVGAAAPAAAKSVEVIGGQTSVLLDTETLASAASLALSGVSDDTIVPGALGEGSVAFAINGRNAREGLPTTFAYDPRDPLNTLEGAIEHTGSVFFNDGTVEVGDFTIAADFTVADNVSGLGVLFDAVPDLTTIVADQQRLFVEGDLEVSEAFAGFLADAGLSEGLLTGADVGDFQVDATVVPLPGAVLFLATGVAGLAGARLYRRRSEAPA